MAGRFTRTNAYAVAPTLAAPLPEAAPVAPRSARLDGVPWTRLPGAEPRRSRRRAAAANPLHSDKLLDAKVRLHRRLIEEINLSALEKLPEDEMRAPYSAAGRAICRWSSGWR